MEGTRVCRYRRGRDDCTGLAPPALGQIPDGTGTVHGLSTGLAWRLGVDITHITHNHAAEVHVEMRGRAYCGVGWRTGRAFSPWNAPRENMVMPESSRNLSVGTNTVMPASDSCRHIQVSNSSRKLKLERKDGFSSRPWTPMTKLECIWLRAGRSVPVISVGRAHSTVV